MGMFDKKRKHITKNKDTKSEQRSQEPEQTVPAQTPVSHTPVCVPTKPKRTKKAKP